MADELGPDTNEKMRALCRKISVAHDLDAEIQEELYSHMEDKLLGYLNGEEALKEEDAFILVREHFGDPSALKGLLQDVHAFEAQVSLARRLAAAMIVTSGISMGCLFITAAISEIWDAYLGYKFFLGMIASISLGSVAFPWLILGHWQRCLDEGRTPWVMTWQPAYLVCAMVVLLLIGPQIQMGSLYAQAEIFHSGFWIVVPLALLLAPVLQCMVWLWWCDRPPRRARAVGFAAGAWTLWAWGGSISRSIAALYAGLNVPSLATNIFLTFLAMTMYGGVSYLLYGVARRAASGMSRWPEVGR